MAVSDALFVFVHRLNQSVIAPICLVRVDNEDGMNKARKVKQQRQKEVEECLNWLSDEQHGQRWEDDGDEVNHGCLLYTTEPL